MTLTPMQRGLLLALIHVLIVATLGVKLLMDRSTLPRVWVETAPVDPDLPIRGRYVQLRLVMPLDGEFPESPYADSERGWQPMHSVDIVLDGDRLVARQVHAWSEQRAWFRETDDGAVAVLIDTIPFFIPEDVADPSIRPEGETLWVEVTVPRKGLPRPIQLGVQQGDEPVKPLSLR